MDIYVAYKWEHIYSFPIYILIAVIVRLIVTVILRIESDAKKAKEA